MKRKWEIEDEKKEVSDRSDSDEKGNVIYTIHIEKLEENGRWIRVRL